MKKNLILLSTCTYLSLVLLWAMSCQAGDPPSPWEVKLPFKSAVIEYKITGMDNGTQTTYIKEYGRYRATHKNTSMKIMGMTTKIKTIDITTPDWIYSIDLTAGTGTKSVNPTKYMIEEYNKLSRRDKKKVMENAKKMGITMMNGVQGEIRTGSATILGYKCDVMKVPGMKIYSIADTDLPLKTESNMFGAPSVIQAVKIRKEAVPDDKFIPPHGINIEYDRASEKRAREDAREMVQALLTGKPLGTMTRPPHVPNGEVSGTSHHQDMPAAPSGNAGPDINEFIKALKGLTHQ